MLCETIRRFFMRIIDYYNAAAILLETVLVFTALFCARKNRKTPPSGTSPSKNSRFFLLQQRMDQLLTGRLFRPAAALLLIFGAFLRMWNLTGLPDGLQQDEASIGYEAFCLAEYGIDRNGYHWPVYPITWGSGGGSPIMIYLNVLTTKLFGSRIFSIRMVPAFLGTLTLLLFFLLLNKAFGRRCALTGLAVLALTPWHIILSRWSLDSNTMPFWQLLALFALVQAICAGTAEHSRRQTGLYLLAAFFFGICLYSYGSANVVIPLTLLFVCIRLLRTKRIRIGQLAGCFAVFVITCLPLALFYAVNFFGVPEIAASWISFPKFTSSHFGSVFVAFDRTLPSTLLHNLKDLLLMLTVGIPGEVSWNAMPGYWTLYCFTFPVTFAGILFGRRTAEKEAPAAQAANDVLGTALLSALLFSLFIQQDINRDVLLFLPLVYWYVMGLRFLYLAMTKGAALKEPETGSGASAKAASAKAKAASAKAASQAAALPALLSLVLLFEGFVSFARDYYGGEYNKVAASDFMPGYGDAMILATELAEKKGEASTVYSTYDLVASPFMLTLYYNKCDPYEFMDSVVYKDPEAEFRVASSFGRYVFGLPGTTSSEGNDSISEDDVLSGLQTPEYANDIFVLTTAQAQAFDDAVYDKAVFKDRFVVVSRKSAG